MRDRCQGAGVAGMYMAQMLWLDFRIYRRLSDMARRVRAGETVRASAVRIDLGRTD